MKKLNNRQLRWIIREMRNGKQSTYRIARQQEITPRYARMLDRRYQDVQGYLIDQIRIQKCGRKPVPLTRYEEVDIMAAKTKYPDLGAVNLETILKSNGIHISHNKIHTYLKSMGLAQTEPKKSRRRKWIRYERKHSNSLWHTDWHETALGQLISYLDDASRYIVAYGIFRHATTENSLKVFYEALERYGPPKQLLTDHGSQFCKDENENYRFRNEVQAKGTELILARVKHPQTNGKQEKFHHTFDRLLRYFDNPEKAMAYYNFQRPHTSLEKEGKPVTPYEAFILKGGKVEKRFLNENAQTVLSRGT
jgi:putative transposase